MDFRAEAAKLVKNLGGRMNPSAYDIAWLARVPAQNHQGTQWPDLIDWLLDHQKPSAQGRDYRYDTGPEA